MASSPTYISFVCSQIADVGMIRSRKMFGDYMVYVDDRPLVLVCDNTPYVKMVPEIAKLMSTAETGVPYDGAKEHYILDMENVPLCQRVLGILKEVIPLPKPRKKRSASSPD